MVSFVRTLCVVLFAILSCLWIIVHNTDNFAAGADALAHARAQYNGNFQNMSAHYYVDDGDTAYQAAPHSRGCWHVGVNYGGNNLFGRYGNRSSIGRTTRKWKI